MKKARYICLEGTEGVGKTTQTQLLCDYLRSNGYSVLLTKEPGVSHAPLTMVLRGIMLDNQYDAAMTMPAREFISQAIRSIHLERVVIPALSQHDYIIQDRGILSGFAYGEACGNSYNDLRGLSLQVIHSANLNKHVLPTIPEQLYDSVVYLRGDDKKNLKRALASKQEFATGDAMESRGDSFIERASLIMEERSRGFNSVKIEVDGKSIEEVHNEILTRLKLKDV